MKDLPVAQLCGVMVDRASRNYLLSFDIGQEKPLMVRLDEPNAHLVLLQLGNWSEVMDQAAQDAPTRGETDG